MKKQVINLKNNNCICLLLGVWGSWVFGSVFELSTYLKNWRHPQNQWRPWVPHQEYKITLGNPKEGKEVGEWMEKQLVNKQLHNLLEN